MLRYVMLQTQVHCWTFKVCEESCRQQPWISV